VLLVLHSLIESSYLPAAAYRLCFRDEISYTQNANPLLTNEPNPLNPSINQQINTRSAAANNAEVHPWTSP